MRRLVSLVMLLALAGCGGSSSGPKTLPPVSASPSASPSPSPTPSMTPEQQVLAAVKAYYAAANEAGATGDVTELESLSAPECDCRKFAQAVTTTYASGSKIVGAVDTLVNAKVARLTPLVAVVNGRIRVSAHELVTKNGTRKPQAADEFDVQIALGKKAGRWLVLSVRDPR